MVRVFRFFKLKCFINFYTSLHASIAFIIRRHIIIVCSWCMGITLVLYISVNPHVTNDDISMFPFIVSLKRIQIMCESRAHCRKGTTKKCKHWTTKPSPPKPL